MTNYIYTAGRRRRDPEVTERNKFVYFLTRSVTFNKLLSTTIPIKFPIISIKRIYIIILIKNINEIYFMKQNREMFK